ncbi:MAG: DUF4412 domain-containing protein [Thermodesulfobacteriota bacterium]
MINRLFHTSYLFLFLPLLITICLSEKALAADGIILKQVRYRKGSPDKLKGKVLISDNKLKFESDVPKQAMILNLNTDDLIIIFKDARQYITAKPNEFFEDAEELNKKWIADKMKQLSLLPPDKRAQMEELMKSQGVILPDGLTRSKTLSFQKSNQDETIAGYKSTKYEIFEDGKIAEEIWVSDSVAKDEIDLQKTANLFKEFAYLNRRESGTTVSPQGKEIYREVFESGFPMKKTSHEPDGTVYIEEITKVSKENIPDSEFVPPNDYKKITLQEMMQQLEK